MKIWRRWDPRFERMPLLEVRDARWVIEVVPDLFEPGAELLLEKVLTKIENVRGSYVGRFMLRTAHPTRAKDVLRGLSDSRSGYGRRSNVPSRIVLAVYAETQAELDERIYETFVPMVRAEDLALTDPDAAIALAMREGALASYEVVEAQEAKAAGPAALATLLARCYRHRHRSRSEGIPVDSGGLALYLRPRERIEIWPLALPQIRELRGHYPQRTFDWIVLSGAVGPMNADGANSPWPMHPCWISRIAATARQAKTPFCVPYLGEWTHYDQREWVGDSLDGGNMSSNDALEDVPHACVNYDPTWQWGERDWDSQHRRTKPHDAYMHAAGSKLVGRALGGRIFDEWPEHWVAR